MKSVNANVTATELYQVETLSDKANSANSKSKSACLATLFPQTLIERAFYGARRTLPFLIIARDPSLLRGSTSWACLCFAAGPPAAAVPTGQSRFSSLDDVPCGVSSRCSYRTPRFGAAVFFRVFFFPRTRQSSGRNLSSRSCTFP